MLSSALEDGEEKRGGDGGDQRTRSRMRTWVNNFDVDVILDFRGKQNILWKGLYLLTRHCFDECALWN